MNLEDTPSKADGGPVRRPVSSTAVSEAEPPMNFDLWAETRGGVDFLLATSENKHFHPGDPPWIILKASSQIPNWSYQRWISLSVPVFSVS